MPISNVTPTIPTDADILVRDRVLADLLGLFRRHPEPARAAGQRLSARIVAWAAGHNEKARRSVEETLTLLPIAREFVLEPDRLKAKARVQVAGRQPPAGFEPEIWATSRAIPAWVWRCYRALGRYDTEIALKFQTLAGHLRNAASGRIGDYCIPRRINLEKTDALTAYVHAMSALWSAGRRTPEEVAESLKPELASNSCATPWFALGEFALELVREQPDLRRRREEWWDVAVLIITIIGPEVEPEAIGMDDLPPWDTDEPGDHSFTLRSQLLDYVGWLPDSTMPGGVEGRVWLLAQRARDVLADAASLSKPTTPEDPLLRLSSGERSVWDALDGHVASAADLAKPCGDTSEQVITGRVMVIRTKLGKDRILNRRGYGYFRPDAPPDWSAQTPRRKRRIRPT